MRDPGRLDIPTLLQKPIDERSPEGDVVRRWETVKQIWAEIRPLSGRERYQAQQVQANVTHRVHVRPDIEITRERQLVTDGGQTLAIQAVLATPRGLDVTTLLCEEIT